MSAPRRQHPINPERALQAAAAIRAAIVAETDDNEAIRDTLAGVVDFESIVEALVLTEMECRAFSEGLDEAFRRLNRRREMFDARRSRVRALIERAMELAGVDTLRTPAGTVSRVARPPKLTLTDEAAVPPQWWVQAKPRLDMAGLTAALRRGEEVPGCRLDNGGSGIIIR